SVDRVEHPTAALRGRLVADKLKMQGDHATTLNGQRGRTLALRGLALFIHGIDETKAAGRMSDSDKQMTALERAHADQKTAVKTLRAAGAALGVRIGPVHGFG